ncbi:MAG: hypothetical protein FJ146_07045 [Deltaproteobacteria bacterium]|nr:hypothetical protein [Deltaproteobacteria bacterium]
MKTLLRLTLATLAATTLSSCVTVKSVSISQIPETSQRKQVVKASATSPVVFLIPFNTDYIEEARADLLQACPNGHIEGLLSKHEDTNYFIGLVYMQKVNFTGYCLPKIAMTRAKAKRKG